MAKANTTENAAAVATDLAAAIEENQQLKNEIADLKSLLADTARNAGAPVPDDAVMQLNTLSAENEALKTELASAKRQLGTLEKETGRKIETFTHNKKKYEVRHGVRIPGLGQRTALEIANDPEAQQWLIENNSGLIKEVK